MSPADGNQPTTDSLYTVVVPFMHRPTAKSEKLELFFIFIETPLSSQSHGRLIYYSFIDLRGAF